MQHIYIKKEYKYTNLSVVLVVIWLPFPRKYHDACIHDPEAVVLWKIPGSSEDKIGGRHPCRETQ
jgi:hypothetical protein